MPRFESATAQQRRDILNGRLGRWLTRVHDYSLGEFLEQFVLLGPKQTKRPKKTLDLPTFEMFPSGAIVYHPFSALVVSAK